MTSRVILLHLGAAAAPGLDLRRISHVANRVQPFFRFELSDPVEQLGDPGDEGEYMPGPLTAILEKRRGLENADFAVGITNSPLDEELFSAVNLEATNIVVSTAATRDILARTEKSLEAYILVEIAAQLLTIEYRRLTADKVESGVCAAPWHKETRRCVFDWCDNRDETGSKLMQPRLCEGCRALFAANGIRQSVIAACLRLVRVAVRPRILALARNMVGEPAISFVLGGFAATLLQDLASRIGIRALEFGGLLAVALLVILLLKIRRLGRNTLI